MPELPEVETVRRIIAPHVIGHTITGISLNPAFPDVLEGPDAIDPVAGLTGRAITGANRRGKYLIFPLDNGMSLVIHLRMTGRLLFVRHDEPPIRFQHAALTLDNDMDLRFGDQRKFGRVRLTLPEEVDGLCARLGPEPLERELTADRLHAALQRRRGKIKAVLLDQHLIAGLGNIYVDEALYRTRIHPLTPANTLSRGDAARLLRAIRHVLRSAIANQGTTFSTFENPYGETGSNVAFLKVYGKGRKALPCPRCHHPLEHMVVGGRGTTYCPSCQQLGAHDQAPGVPG